MAPHQTDPTTAYIGLALCFTAAAITYAHYAWAWWQTRSFDDHCGTAPGITDLRDLPCEEAAYRVLAPDVLAAAEAITKEAAR